MKTSSIVVMCLAVTLAGAQAQVARAADPAATNTAGKIKINRAANDAGQAAPSDTVSIVVP